MDFKTLSLVIALRATDRGALPHVAAEVAEQIVARLSVQPQIDLVSALAIIEQEFFARSIPTR